MDLNIIPECYIDTNLIETLVSPTGRGYNHQKGCGTVAKTMQDLPNEFALGIIDKDKKVLDCLNEFDELITIGSLVLHKHRERPHYIIQISPAIEQFILKATSETGISPDQYGLPNQLAAFKKESKTEQSKKDPRFRNLFKALITAEVTDFAVLAKWVEHLKNNPYSVDLDHLGL